VEIGKVDQSFGIAAVLPAAPPVSPEQRAEQQRMVQAVKAINKAELFGEASELTFGYDRTSKKMVLRLVDRETKEVIRQLPPEYLLRLAEDLETR
jgi:flagellar protein FlaG